MPLAPLVPASTQHWQSQWHTIEATRKIAARGTIGRCCHAHDVPRRSNGWAEGWLEAMGAFLWQSVAAGGAGGAGGLVAAAVLAGGALLAVADRRHQAAADALLDVCDSVPFLGTEAAAQPARRIEPPQEFAGPPEPAGSAASLFHAGTRGRGRGPGKPARPVAVGTLGGDFLAGMAHVGVAGGRRLATPRRAAAAFAAGRLVAAGVAADAELARLVAELAGSVAFAACRRPCRWPRIVRCLSAGSGGRGWYCPAG